ncbi:MAG: nitroreductase family protein [Halobacteriota archaeon]
MSNHLKVPAQNGSKRKYKHARPTEIRIIANVLSIIDSICCQNYGRVDCRKAYKEYVRLSKAIPTGKEAIAMDVTKAILSRRSIRKYADEPISDEDVEALLRAAMHAPSGVNEQPWHFVVIKDRKILDAIPRISRTAQMVKHAPLAIAVCADKNLEKFPGLWALDCSAATENILLAATARGLGAVWTAVYPFEDRIKGIKKLLNLPGEVIPLCVIPVGRPAETLAPVDRFNPSCIHYETW